MMIHDFDQQNLYTKLLAKYEGEQNRARVCFKTVSGDISNYYVYRRLISSKIVGPI